MDTWNIAVNALDVCLSYNIAGAGSFNVANCYSVKD